MSDEPRAFNIAEPSSFLPVPFCFFSGQFVADINDLIAANREIAALKVDDFSLSSAIRAAGFGQAFIRISSNH